MYIGLASALAIFSALSDALEWILRKRRVRAVIHYMDDFLLMGAPGTAECRQALATTIATCEKLGDPLAVDKPEGPATELSFLGIQLNAREMCTSLPPDKLVKLRTMVKELVGARVVRDRQQLESLVGHLVHAATVFPLGKAFLNALFATKAAIKPGQIGRLNLAVRSELAWWDLLLEHWPGSLVHQFLLLKAARSAYSHRCSGILGLWCMVSATLVPGTVEQGVGLADKKLLPEVIVVAIWGNIYRGQVILCHCDNAAVVSQVNWLHAQDPQASHMLRCLAYLQPLYDCRLRVAHVAGSKNIWEQTICLAIE